MRVITFFEVWAIRLQSQAALSKFPYFLLIINDILYLVSFQSLTFHKADD